MTARDPDTRLPSSKQRSSRRRRGWGQNLDAQGPGCFRFLGEPWAPGFGVTSGAPWPSRWKTLALDDATRLERV